MAQLSSYDSPDTPETDDSVEVKILCSCPSPGSGPYEAKGREFSFLEHLEEGARVVCTAQNVIRPGGDWAGGRSRAKSGANAGANLP